MRIRGLVIIFYLLLISIKGISQVTCNVSLLATPINASCDNACNGSVLLTPSGGTAPYSFNAFDHSFNTANIDAALFDTYQGNFSIITPGRLTAQANAAINSSYANSIATKQAFPDNGKLVLEASFFIDYNAYTYFGLSLNDDSISNRNQFAYSFFFSNGTLFIFHEGSSSPVSTYSSSTWYDFKIEKLGNTVNYYIRNTGVSAYTLISTKPATFSNPNYKLAALYRNSFSSYGGFSTTNWRVGGNPPTTDLCPGTYTYTVFDALGCFATANVTIGGGGGANSLQLNGTVSAASCGAASDGGINLTPTGGTEPYSYGFAHVFQGGSINTNIFELRNGNFSQGTDLRQGTNYNTLNSWDNSIATKQSFSDGGYLVMDASFKFDANAEVIFGFTSTGVINDYSKMLAGFRVSNGSLLYAYNKIAGLHPVGTINPDTWYDFKIEKVGSLVKFYSRPYNTGSYNLLYTTTYPTTNIEFKAAALNFASFYSSSAGYNTKGWNIQSTPKVTQLAPGTYTYTITDANGCTATSVFNVGSNGNNSVSLNASLISGSIANTSTGEVSLTAIGGLSPYSYVLAPDFSGSVINNAVLKVLNGDFIQNSGSIRSNSTSSSIWENSIATHLSFTDAGKLSLTGSFSFDANSNTYFGFTSNANLIDPAQVQIGYYINGSQLYARSGSNNYLIGSLISSNTWYDLKIEKTKSLVRYYLRNAGSGSYNLIYTLPYTGSTTEFKAGVLMFGTSGGFNTNGWIVDCNPSTTGLAAGLYTYRVYDAKGCYAIASINVPVSGSITLTAQGNNSSVWNVCDGSATVTSNPANNFELVSKVFQESFTGTQFNSTRFTRRNGAFTQNDALLSGTNFNNSGWDNSVITNDAFADNGIIIAEMELSFKNNTEVYFGLASINQALTSYTSMPFAFSYQKGQLLAYSSQAGNIVLGSLSANQWYGFKIVKKGASVTFYLRNANDIQYQPIYSLSTTETGLSYKLGLINFFNTQTGIDKGYSSKNWKVYNQAITTGLCQGNYNYALVANGNTLTEANVLVGTTLSVVQTMTGPANVVVNTDATKDFATGVNLGSPTFNGPTTNITVTNDAPTEFPVGITEVTWIANDGIKIVTGIQTVTVVDNEAPSITAPANVSVTLFAGQTTATGVILGTAIANDNVAGVTVTNNAPLQFPIGNTTVTWTATDVAGNTATATQIVTVIETSLPTITAPADVLVDTDTDQSYASGVNLGTPNLSVNISGITITNNAPAQFTLGTTTVTWTISDAFGNSASVTQLITVIDNQPPTISVPADVTVSANTGVSYASPVSLGTATAIDNVGAVITNNALTQYPIGTTLVTWTATDAAGNMVTATQKVIVKDDQLPTITAPGNITVNTNPGEAVAINVALGNATVSDNVGAVASNNAPASYNIGTTIVTWTATDAAGNSANATQTVIVVDNELPTITPPANITTTVGVSQTHATVTLGTPVFGDNAPGAVVTNNAPAQFPVGTTIVTWTVTDASGNFNTATQTITVNVADEPPVAKCKPVELFLVNGQATLSTSQINDGSIAAAGIASMTLSKTLFGCNDIGANAVVFTVIDNNGLSSTCTTTVNVIGEVPGISITSMPTNNTFTGGNATNLYIGYGAQSTTLQVNAPSTGAPYTYSWIGTGLSSTTAASPTFTPATAGNYVFVVTAKNKFGCNSVASINICVKDVRVVGKNGKKDDKKVYICHIPPGNPANAHTLEVSINAVAAHLQHGDVLGSCNQLCGTAAKAPIAIEENFDVKVSPNPTSNYFVIQVQSSDRSNNISLRMMDAYGRTIQKETIGVGSIFKFGENFANGTYYLEAIQGKEKKVIKLLKL